jgi:mono/diheme cytochrome c family protein
MKQALSSEGPARVRRGHLRAFTLGIGASALAMACSFGEIDAEGDGNIDPIDPIDNSGAEPSETPDDQGEAPVGNPGAPNAGSPSAGNTNTPDQSVGSGDPNDPFGTPLGQEVKEILQTNCGDCHIGQGAQGDFGYLLDVQALIDGDKLVPGAKEDSQLYNRMVGGTMPPAFRRVIQTPTYGQIDQVGKWIDELELPDPAGECEPLEFMGVDEQIELMQADMQSLDPVTEQPFTRYLTITYSSNAGECGRALQRQRYALFKGINSVSTNPVVGRPVAIDENETIYRIDIQDYNWDRDIDIEDDGIVDFPDAWEAIVANNDNATAAFMIEYQGDNADDLKLDAQTNVPFMPVNVFLQATEFGDLYYTLIGGKANLFDFELEVLGIDTVAEIADNNLVRAGFANSGVSKQERVLNRFDSGVAGNQNYWISFDFDGGGGGEVAGEFVQNLANESIFSDPLGFAFAGGEAIFSLPNGLQAYYVANAAGDRLATAPIGVVIDPAQNNGLVTNGASCHSCHNAGMITFTDQVRSYVEENKRDFDNDTYEDVMEQYVDAVTFQRIMDQDSEVHIAAMERAGIPRKTPDAISRVYLDFQLGNVTLNVAAAEFGIEPEELRDNLDLLNPELANLAIEGGYVDRNIMEEVFLDSVCILQQVQENTPVGCP